MDIVDKISKVTKLEPNATYVITVNDGSNEDLSIISDSLSLETDYKFIIVSDRITFQHINDFTTYGVSINSASKDDIDAIINQLSKCDVFKNYKFIITPNNILSD